MEIITFWITWATVAFVQLFLIYKAMTENDSQLYNLYGIVISAEILLALHVLPYTFLNSILSIIALLIGYLAGVILKAKGSSKLYSNRLFLVVAFLGMSIPAVILLYLLA